MKRKVLIWLFITVAPFVFYGWLAAFGKFMQILEHWVKS